MLKLTNKSRKQHENLYSHILNENANEFFLDQIYREYETKNKKQTPISSYAAGTTAKFLYFKITTFEIGKKKKN
ncbi:hypothetical protein DERP_008943 [Dermatophagoides pteronyssinus]|uniref:Uncharacterized protein n=1 Tax=Dermatophagoides pteronyssinus TaxID=6956 RepID=A0ABQ8JNQ6_DERPT|nr:hypothetical protein DERP_008943 [Dermatophagoides pteronyssinus]